MPAEGTSVAGGEDALGHGDVRVCGGTLRVAERLRVRGAYAQDAAPLRLGLRAGGKAPLPAPGRAGRLGGAVAAARRRAAAGGGRRPAGAGVPRLRGRFSRIEVNPDRLRAVPVYTAEGLSVRLVKR
ncbi:MULTISPECIES: hypothetical protein [Streptomyces]|uniref:hypothetical protein n=1 Tax=Streptomyces TaxID=1883 RepID=UPI0004CD3688